MGLAEGDASRRSVLKGSALGAGALFGAAGLASRQRAAAATPSNPNIVVDGENLFLKLDGIAGESVAKNFLGYIELTGFSFGAGNSAAARSRSTGTGAGKATPHELTVTKYVDASSPLLMLHTVNGRLIQNAQLQVATDAAQVVYLKCHLTDVLVSSYQIETDPTTSQPQESVSLSFDKIQYSYYPQATAGSVGKPVTMNWNIKTARSS
jgi:type VI secretion system secreted protein Hcp